MKWKEEKNMKRKIVGILICMLVFATAVPAVTAIRNNTINIKTPNPQASMTTIWTEEQKLLPSDGAINDQLGGIVIIDGDTALVGVCYNDDLGTDSGSAYVFTRSGSIWTQQAKLLASDGAAGDEFGYCVDLDGDTALVGAIHDDDNGADSGSAYVFTRSGFIWTQQAKLLTLDGAAGDQFGFYVSLDHDTAVISANWDDDNGNDSGSVYVFVRSGTTWTQQAKLLPSDGQAGDRFALCTLSGDTALIGTYYDDDNGIDSGSAYIFVRNGTTWMQQAKLLPSDGAAGDNFGFSTSIDGDTALVGTWKDDDNGADSGSVYVFVRSGTTWMQQAKLLPSDGAAGDQFGGYSFSFSGNTALIGSPGDDDKGSNSGSAYVFVRSGTTWTQQAKILASDGAAGDQFGISTFIDGDTGLIGAPYDDDNGGNSGSAYVFTRVGLTTNITGGFGVTLKVTNDGLVNVTEVPWWIHVEGGIFGLINKTMNGTINISAGETIPVTTVKMFGLGPITINVKVADEEQTATGTQLFIFSLVK
jgi:hypothetical protein